MFRIRIYFYEIRNNPIWIVFFVGWNVLQKATTSVVNPGPDSPARPGLRIIPQDLQHWPPLFKAFMFLKKFRVKRRWKTNLS